MSIGVNPTVGRKVGQSDIDFFGYQKIKPSVTHSSIKLDFVFLQNMLLFFALSISEVREVKIQQGFVAINSVQKLLKIIFVKDCKTT